MQNSKIIGCQWKYIDVKPSVVKMSVKPIIHLSLVTIQQHVYCCKLLFHILFLKPLVSNALGLHSEHSRCDLLHSQSWQVKCQQIL